MLRTAGYMMVLIVLSVAVSGEEWIWRNPLPTANNIGGLDEIDPAGSMIAVGTCGTILLTNDNWNSFVRAEVPLEVEGIDFFETE